MTLAELNRGDSAQIIAIDSKKNSVQRLMVMGLVEGTEIEFLGRSLGGDPIELLIHGSALSLRETDARHFTVTLAAKKNRG
mgnify:FL=1